MKPSLWKRFIVIGAVVTATNLAGSAPLPFRCWWRTLIGTEKTLPRFHSKLTAPFGSSPTTVAPRPSST